MRILLTGGTGYIGSHTAITLTEAGHDVILLDNLYNSQIKVLDRIEEILNKKVIFYEADVRNTALVTEILKKEKVDAIIHLAGLKAVGESWKKPIDYYACNVGGSISLASAMKAAGLHILVFSSSATVYGAPKYLPYDEDHPTSPTNPYGRNKLQVEQLLQDIANSDSNWSIACLRYFNPVGAHQTGLIGENPNGIPNNLMPIVAQVATGRLSMLNIYGNDYETIDGTGMRDYIHVMDLAEGHLAAIEWIENNRGCHYFNLGSGTSHSVLELVSEFEKASGKVIPRQVVSRREGDLPNYYAQADKAFRLLNWKTSRNLSDMCESTWGWEKQRFI
jgi:UDP-glucose 4-epimerase